MQYKNKHFKIQLKFIKNNLYFVLNHVHFFINNFKKNYIFHVRIIYINHKEIFNKIKRFFLQRIALTIKK